MKYKIHYKDIDEIVIEADTLNDIIKKALDEGEKRNWKPEDCWSEEIKDGAK